MNVTLRILQVHCSLSFKIYFTVLEAHVVVYLLLYKQLGVHTYVEHIYIYIYIYIYRVSQEECARLWEGVPYVKEYQ